MEYNSPYKQLKRKMNTWCLYQQRIDTYGLGCEHECSYCYAKGLLYFRGFWGKPTPSNLVIIKKQIEKSNGIIRLGSMTDCFQPCEKEFKLTYKTIKLLNWYRKPYLIVTKSDMVADSEYLDIYDPDLAHFQVTITGLDQFENAPSIYKRIQAVEKLHKLGFDVSVRLSPFILEYADIRVINRIHCNKILIEFLKVNHFIKKWFKIDYSRYNLSYGNYKHLHLDFKIMMVNKITNYDQISVGEYVPEHHKYFSENVNFNKNDCCNLNYTPKKEYKQLEYDFKQSD